MALRLPVPARVTIPVTIRFPMAANVPVPAKAQPEAIDLPQEEPLKLECEHFLRCVATGQTPRTDGHEGLRVLRILNASQRSLDQSGRKVFLSFGSVASGTQPSAMPVQWNCLPCPPRI